MGKWNRLWAVVLLSVALAMMALACDGESTPTPTTSTETATTPTSAPTATMSQPAVDEATPTAAATPVPTATSEPTATPTTQPTATSVPAPQPTATSIPATQPAPDDIDLEALLESAALAMEDVDSFHFEMDMTIKAGVEGMSMEILLNAMGDFQLPDRSKGTMEYTLAGLNIQTEYVQIGTAFYVTDPFTGEWVAATEGESVMPFDSTTMFLEPALDIQLQDLALLGVETLDGVQTLRVSGLVPASMFAMGIEGVEDLQAELWVGVEDHLVRRMSITGELSGDLLGMGSGQPGALSLTMNLSNYNAPVTIEAPEVTGVMPTVPGNGAGIDCAPYMELLVASDTGASQPITTSFRCQGTHIDFTGMGPDDGFTFTMPHDSQINLHFNTDIIPNPDWVEMRLYPVTGLYASFLTWPEDLPEGGTDPVESLGTGSDFSHTFAWGPGEYTLVIRATWGTDVEVFYAINLTLEP